MPKYQPTLNDRKVISLYLREKPLYGYNLGSSMQLDHVPAIEKATFIVEKPVNLANLTSSVFSTEDGFSACLDKLTLSELGINPLTMELED
ncbi:MULTISPECIES: hypothetical protein [Vibrio]|uniref:hypothetical protein n=1 Tax=Vibrio TaxID=662 RepID=UPI00078E023A|nr:MULTISPECIES: hypothetical protein [Vibrio]BAU70779.1 hypothetical protein [Vibrio sp. 04Ya108]BBM67653.1 hypothetical protein VA249_42990 [Vibrio alfacsensis]BCN27135.1 hypothetical protein VYA_43270 [Vibrio alfacsensis]